MVGWQPRCLKQTEPFRIHHMSVWIHVMGTTEIRPLTGWLCYVKTISDAIFILSYTVCYCWKPCLNGHFKAFSMGDPVGLRFKMLNFWSMVWVLMLDVHLPICPLFSLHYVIKANISPPNKEHFAHPIFTKSINYLSTISHTHTPITHCSLLDLFGKQTKSSPVAVQSIWH